jgi:N-acetylmuramoyl-L-alanine amidase
MTKRSIILLLLCLWPLAAFSRSVLIENIRINHLSTKTQYVVDLSGMVPVTEHTYYKPYRKVFSFYHAKLAKHISTSHLTNNYVADVRLQRVSGRVSLGLHLTKAYPVHASFWSADGNKRTRYVIDVSKSGARHISSSSKQVTFDRAKALQQFHKEIAPSLDAFVRDHIGGAVPTHHSMTHTHKVYHKTASAKHHAASESPMVQVPTITTSTPQFNEKAKRYSSKIIVVIDPGHGGKDPGATGPHGHHEKKVVLAIAKQLQKQINSYKGFKAVLTRGDDRYLTLRYRLALAREYHGDMFVAIHADAYINSSAFGASVFALSQRGATSEAARWLAQRENQSELMGGVDLADKDRTLRSVLIDLSQTATIGASLNMGSGIIVHLREVTPMHANHVEQAAFVVLKSPDIPSLLIETGFISNPTEEQQLIMRSHQKRLAQAIAKGIVQYFKTHPPRGSWLATESKG